LLLWSERCNSDPSNNLPVYVQFVVITGALPFFLAGRCVSLLSQRFFIAFHLSLHVYILLVLIVLLYDTFHVESFSLTEVGDNTVIDLGLTMWEKLTSIFSVVIMAGTSAWS